MSFLKKDYYYDLPDSLIAKEPLSDRGQAKMLCLNRQRKTMQDSQFYHLLDYISSDSLVVVNDTKVIPSRLLGVKETGAKIEILLVKQESQFVWRAMIKGIGRLKKDEKITLCDGNIIAYWQERITDKEGRLYFEAGTNLWNLLEQYAYAPLPPYISKHRNQEQRIEDKKNYQTMFAKEYGAIAAPTAGLHFTKETYEQLQKKGISFANITLHVGLGTFESMVVDDIREHAMHFESYHISEIVANQVNQALQEKRPIVAIGTTTARTLESAVVNGKVQAGEKETNLFIYSPYQFQVISQMVTNFHLPNSTLLMMISAFAGKEFVMQAYQHAVEEKYRFYSFGDCMLIQ